MPGIEPGSREDWPIILFQSLDKDRYWNFRISRAPTTPHDLTFYIQRYIYILYITTLNLLVGSRVTLISHVSKASNNGVSATLCNATLTVAVS